MRLRSTGRPKAPRITSTDHDRATIGTGRWPAAPCPLYSWGTMIGAATRDVSRTLFERRGVAPLPVEQGLREAMRQIDRLHQE